MKYEFTILKKVRSKLIACFSDGNFSIPEDYTLSSAEENIKTFTAKAITGKGKEGILFQLQKQITVHFNGSVSSKIQGNTLIIDAQKIYEEIAKETEKPEESVPSLKKVIEETPVLDMNPEIEIPKPIGPFGEKIISFLKERFLSDTIIRATEINFSETKDGEFRIQVKEYSVSILWQILKALEENSELCDLLYYEPCAIVIKKGKVNTEARRSKTLLNSFLTELGSFTAKHKIPFVLKTPFSVAISENPLKLSISAENKPATFALFNILLAMGTNWYPELKEDAIKITLGVEDMRTTIEKGITGPLPQNIPLGNIQEETIRPGVYKKDEPRILPKHKVLPVQKGSGRAKTVPASKNEEKAPTGEIEILERQVQALANDIHELLTKKGLERFEISRAASGSPVYGYVHESYNYDDFHFLPFNRKTRDRHVQNLKGKILKRGVLGFVTVVVTDIIDGTMRKYIVDGQHRFKAFKELGMPILYTYVQGVKTKEELVEIIAELNNSSRSWGMKDYMFAWRSVYEELYGFIDNQSIEKKLPLTTVLESYSGLSTNAAKERFKNGKFEIKDREAGNKLIEEIACIKEHLPKSSKLYSGFISFLRKTEDYDRNKMLENLKKNPKLRVEPTEKQEETIRKISAIYYNQAA